MAMENLTNKNVEVKIDKELADNASLEATNKALKALADAKAEKAEALGIGAILVTVIADILKDLQKEVFDESNNGKTLSEVSGDVLKKKIHDLIDGTVKKLPIVGNKIDTDRLCEALFSGMEDLGRNIAEMSPQELQDYAEYIANNYEEMTIGEIQDYLQNELPQQAAQRYHDAVDVVTTQYNNAVDAVTTQYNNIMGQVNNLSEKLKFR